MPRVHVIGAGLAGLACATRLAARGHAVCLHEAAGRAGGRCRSYFDDTLGRVIDNGNHLLLSANRAALAYLDDIGARDTLTGPDQAAFPFLDLATGERWTVRPNRGPLPWWVFAPSRRVPATRPADYLSALSLLTAGPNDTVADRLPATGPLHDGFWRPLTVAALNAAPAEASARLLRKVMLHSFAPGATNCRPLVVRDSLSASFVDPGRAALEERGGTLRLNHRLRSIALGHDRARTLEFAGDSIDLAAGDSVVLAVTPAIAAGLLPGLIVPEGSRAIVNGHIRLPQVPKTPIGQPFVGLIDGTVDWLFRRGDIASLTVSAADALAERPAAEIAALFWADTARALGLDPAAAPTIRIIKEKRATFAQTPAALSRRPGPRTAWRNLFLAGDWTDTGYPATIDSAVRSGYAAADLIERG